MAGTFFFLRFSCVTEFWFQLCLRKSNRGRGHCLCRLPHCYGKFKVITATRSSAARPSPSFPPSSLTLLCAQAQAAKGRALAQRLPRPTLRPPVRVAPRFLRLRPLVWNPKPGNRPPCRRRARHKNASKTRQTMRAQPDLNHKCNPAELGKRRRETRKQRNRPESSGSSFGRFSGGVSNLLGKLQGKFRRKLLGSLLLGSLCGSFWESFGVHR